ncbi:hypothetical protein GWI33_006747 [Rhynchophorus ferrugineus]|uniref:Uncharacterized protein n=1 Tax=Rhynchophorus ferrugineus TaxID=354439 RepID=A0A834IKN6_RHYFE|nr:hypothetical protein GWI33_006747 [Rhynchophorus ferrugineus]
MDICDILVSPLPVRWHTRVRGRGLYTPSSLGRAVTALPFPLTSSAIQSGSRCGVLRSSRTLVRYGFEIAVYETDFVRLVIERKFVLGPWGAVPRRRFYWGAATIPMRCDKFLRFLAAAGVFFWSTLVPVIVADWW